MMLPTHTLRMTLVLTIIIQVKNILYKIPRVVFDDHLQSFTRMITPSMTGMTSPGPAETVESIPRDHDGPFEISDDIHAYEMTPFLKFLAKK